MKTMRRLQTIFPSRGVAMLAMFLMGGCEPTAEVSNRPPPELPDSAAPLLSGCNPPLWVPSGDVWLGPMLIDNGAAEDRICDDKNVGTAQFLVKDVFLDADEVTNSCYQHCVDAGACEPPIAANDPDAPVWADPLASEFPAIIDQQRAEDFCAFRRGRLASVAELARAAQGNSLSVGPPELLKAWAECYEEDFVSSECATLALQAHDPGSGPLRPSRRIRSEPRDVGPFGHYDLFGSQAELSGTRFPSNGYPDNWCAEGTVAPLSFTTEADGLRATYLPGLTLALNYTLVVNGPVQGMLVNLSWNDLPSPSLGGARCAYDIVP